MCAELKAGTPQELFAMNAGRGYTTMGDWQRFLFVTSVEETGVPPFTVVLNPMTEVKR